jgi:hypothetical protein
VIGDFQALSEAQRRFFTGATVLHGELVTSGCPNRFYFAPFQHCVKRVVSYAEVGGHAHFYFGLDRSFAKYAKALYEGIKNGKQPDETRERLGVIGFPLAKQTPQLQAADLLAYLTARHMEQSSVRGPTLPEPVLAGLISKIRMPEDHTFLNESAFRNTIAPVLPFVPVLAFEREDELDLPETLPEEPED